FGQPSVELFLRLDKGIENRDLTLAFQLAEEVVSEGIHLPHFLQGLAEHYRLRLMEALGLSDGSKKDERIAEEMLLIFQNLMATIEKLPHQPLMPLHLERILLNILTVKDRPPLALLVRKVEALQQQDRKGLAAPQSPSLVSLETKKHPSELRKEADPKKVEALLEFAAVELKGSRKRVQ
ncbi:MAG: hypothetical protein VXZ72_03200, partial [Chlamydiota bacterium]|nr:hypothetical protein [Chlamydiota bacterium]